MELQQVILVEQAAASIREACNKVLVRRRESIEHETITLLTHEMQRKEEAKALERQLKEVQKEANREKKQAENERKKEEKNAAKTARRTEKKKRSRHALVAFKETAEVEEEREDNDLQLQQQFTLAAADEIFASSASARDKEACKDEEIVKPESTNNQIISGADAGDDILAITCTFFIPT